ncbi:uncharacterized protein JCM15063_003204 [Sporobolomyces koalae]|uniref:uncharacterized protein n=1 Tax=Sporobolomyces koalae TaxID=500713 RepID=UPI00316C959A
MSSDENEEFPTRAEQSEENRKNIAHATVVGKRATGIGIGASVAGVIASIVGLLAAAKSDHSQAKFRTTFGLILACWVCILIVQGMLLWEVADRQKTHNQILVRRFQLANRIFVIGPPAITVLLAFVWGFNGSFSDDQDHTVEYVVLLFLGIIYAGGGIGAMIVYEGYVRVILKTHAQASIPLQNPAKTLVRKVSDVSRRRVGSLKSSISITSRKSSLKSGTGGNQKGLPTASTDGSTTDSDDSEESAVQHLVTPKIRSRRGALENVPQRTPLVKQAQPINRIASPDSSDSSSLAHSDDAANSKSLPRASVHSKPSSPFTTDRDRDELHLWVPEEPPKIPRKPLAYMADKQSLSPTTIPSSLSTAHTSRAKPQPPQVYRPYSPQQTEDHKSVPPAKRSGSNATVSMQMTSRNRTSGTSPVNSQTRQSQIQAISDSENSGTDTSVSNVPIMRRFSLSGSGGHDLRITN